MRHHRFDPFAPIVRDPRSRRDRTAAIRDMASTIRTHAFANGECTDEDLLRAGFTVGELDALHGEAMALVEGRDASLAHRDETVLDMAAFMALTAQEAIDGDVTRADLHRGGFTDAEIDACRADAVLETRRRLRPRRVARHERDAA